MATLIDSYSETNQNSDYNLIPDTYSRSGMGQSFTGNGATLGSAKLYLKKTGAPSGNIYCRIYTGSTVPTTLVATSDALTGAALSTSYGLITFNFSGAEQITLTEGTKYWVCAWHESGSSSNYVTVGYDNSSPTHSGESSFHWDNWSLGAGQDMCFYVYEAEAAPSSSIKTINGLAKASVKTVNGLAIASVKTWDGLA